MSIPRDASQGGRVLLFFAHFPWFFYIGERIAARRGAAQCAQPFMQHIYIISVVFTQPP